MAERADLLPRSDDPAAAAPPHGTGVLPYQAIQALVRDGEIAASDSIAATQVQPASIDLRLGYTAHRVRASFLPGETRTVADMLAQFSMHSLDLSDDAVLEKGCVYIVPLMEGLNLSSRISGMANPKSSAGRLDIFTRLITDGATQFDRVPAGFGGPLFAEISPRAFSIVVRAGSRLNQLRLRRGEPAYSDRALYRLHQERRLIDRDLEQSDVVKGLPLRVDLRREEGSRPIGFRAKKHTGLIDLDKLDHYDPADFWDPIFAERWSGLILNPGDFYILASKEAVKVPPDQAAEMVAYDTLVGEFRVHYAGFFDPGFGHEDAGATGTRAVLEVRSHEVPFLVEDGQTVGRLLYERLTDRPDRIYGAEIGSSYQRQGLTLSKQFRPWE
ncbi:MAG: 2'-deoxycytidine 5'-triphosphate deaminase [Kiloniellales bacterium]